MFKNKKLEVKLVSDDNDDRQCIHFKTPITDYVQLARETGKDVVKGAVVLTAVYIAADTLRRTAVHIIATKIK